MLNFVKNNNGQSGTVRSSPQNQKRYLTSHSQAASA